MKTQVPECTGNRDQLAISGGRPVCKDVLPPWPQFEQDEIDAVTRVLRSGKTNYLVGSEGERFEKEFADYCGVRFGVAVANGTVALELALIALGIGTGDEVIVTPRTFIASASSVVLCGAIPVFADVDADSQNISHETISPHITPRTKAIIAVHLAGLPCDIDPIMELAAYHGLFVIEDCAQAHGATYKGRSVGSLGHVAAFSFCQDKIISTGGEGGMLVTDDKSVWGRAWAFKDHGKNYQSVFRRDHPAGFRWLHDSFGTNWRLTEMQSAMGRVQLRKLGDWHIQRTRNANILRKGLAGISGIRIPDIPSHVEHAWYKFYFFTQPSELQPGWSRDRLMEAVEAEGIPCYSGICPEVYLENAFSETAYAPETRLKVVRQLGQNSLMLLVHPTLQPEDMRHMVTAIQKVFAVAGRSRQG